MEENKKEENYSRQWKLLHERIVDYSDKEKKLREKFPNITDEEIRRRIGRSQTDPISSGSTLYLLTNEEYESLEKNQTF